MFSAVLAPEAAADIPQIFAICTRTIIMMILCVSQHVAEGEHKHGLFPIDIVLPGMCSCSLCIGVHVT